MYTTHTPYIHYILHTHHTQHTLHTHTHYMQHTYIPHILHTHTHLWRVLLASLSKYKAWASISRKNHQVCACVEACIHASLSSSGFSSGVEQSPGICTVSMLHAALPLPWLTVWKALDCHHHFPARTVSWRPGKAVGLKLPVLGSCLMTGWSSPTRHGCPPVPTPNTLCTECALVCASGGGSSEKQAKFS